MANYLEVLEETGNVTSSNRGLCTKNDCVAACKQTIKGLPYIYSQRRFEK